MNNINENIRISEGNRVLRNTEDSAFLIFNLPAGITCPYATDFCKKYCYAKSSQDLFKSKVLAARLSNFEESKKKSFVKDMIEVIEYHMNKKKYKDKHIYFRFHESGDIYSKNYFKKILAITDHFKGNEKITFQTYTKSLPLIRDYNLDDLNIKIKFSIIEGTPKRHITEAKERGLSFFIAVPKESIDESVDIVCNGDCGVCKRCYEKDNNDNILIKFHGGRVPKKTGCKSKVVGKTFIYFKE